jgi:hypothetical protein
VTAGHFGDAIDGLSVRQVIDTKLAALMHTYDPGLSIAPAVCPERIDVSGGKRAYCTVRVNGEPVRVSVTYAGPPQKFLVAKDTSFIEMAMVERSEEASLLSEHGIRASVRCGTPRYRLLDVGTRFTCSVENSTKLKTLRLKTEADGRLFTYNPAGMFSPRWMVEALREHTSGSATIVDGATVAAWIREGVVDALPAARLGAPPQIVTECPASLHLTGTQHGRCSESINKLRVRLDVWIDASGLHGQALDAVIDRSKVRRAAQDDFNGLLQRNGFAPTAAVHCDSGLLVVTPPGIFYCTARIAGKAYRVEVKIDDSKGTAHWRAIPMARPKGTARGGSLQLSGI